MFRCAYRGDAPTSAIKEDTTRSDSSQQPLLQECLDATAGTPGTQGGLIIYTLEQEKALCPPPPGLVSLLASNLLAPTWEGSAPDLG